MTGLVIAWALAAALLPSSVANVPAPLPSDVTNQVRATVDLDLEGSHDAVALVVQGDQAALAIQPAGRPQSIQMIDSPDAALVVLQDIRFAPLWPALPEWGGADLSKLRASMVARA